MIVAVPEPPGTWTWDAYASELRIPAGRIETGKQLVQAVIEVVEEHGLPWQPVMRKGYVAIQRPGGYNVLVVDLYWNRVPRLAAKIPGPPGPLGLTSPFPALQEVWTDAEHEWGWTVPPGTKIPDVAALIELVLPFHPAQGPMTTPEWTETP